MQIGTGKNVIEPFFTNIHQLRQIYEIRRDIRFNEFWRYMWLVNKSNLKGAQIRHHLFALPDNFIKIDKLERARFRVASVLKPQH